MVHGMVVTAESAAWSIWTSPAVNEWMVASRAKSA